MNNQQWNFIVTIVSNSVYEDTINPEFRFNMNEKEKMMEFIYVCLENGHEVSAVKKEIRVISKINTD